jgi:hypothetical protein
MIAIEVKSRDPKITWEIVGMYMAPNDDTRVMEILAARTDYKGNSTKRGIIVGDLNLAYVDWNGNAVCSSGNQAFINNLVWENGFTQIVGSPTRGDSLLDVYLVCPESSFTDSSIVQGISDHRGVLLEFEWQGNCCVPQVERLVPVYHKTDVLGLQNLLREKYGTSASNGSSVEEIWSNIKKIVSECIERFLPHKIHRKNPDPQHYSKEVKRLKIKVRKAYNRRKLGEQHLQAVKRLSK